MSQVKKDSLPGTDNSSVSEGEREGRFELVTGARLPDFVYTDFKGAQHQFSDLHARYRLIDFWATWCLPCVADLASKETAYAKFHPLGLEILNIDYEERDTGAAEKFISKRKIPWPQARFDRSLVFGKFGVYEIPTFVLVDSNNVIVSVTTNQSGELVGDALNRALSKLLSSPK